MLAAYSPQGEIVTFDGVQVRSNVNRLPEQPPMPGKIDASTEEASVIDITTPELEKLSSIPARGQSFTDQFGYVHSVNGIRHLGQAVRFECEVIR